MSLSSHSQDAHFLNHFQEYNNSSDNIFEKILKNDEAESKSLIKQEEMDIESIINQKDIKIDHKKSKGKSRDKKKVFYKDKFAGLLKPGENIKQEYNYINYNQFEKGKSPISKEQQLKRNAQSAKNSRQRKKQYITLLEDKNNDNMRAIHQLEQKLRIVTMQRDRLKESNNSELKSFFESKTTAYSELEKAIKNECSDQMVKGVVKSMLQRFGASGSQRLQAITYHMNEIIEALLSDIHKYFISSSVLTKISNKKEYPRIDNQILTILGLDHQKLFCLKSKYKERFVQESSVFRDLTQQFYRIFSSIKNQAIVIENVFLDLCGEIDNKRLAKLMLFFEEQKFCRDIKNIRKEWMMQLKEGQEQIQTLRKQTKQR